MTMNVFDLDQNWLRLDEALEDAGGELTSELEAILNELINESKPALERAGHYLKALENVTDVCKDRKKALDATIARTEAKASRVKAVLVNVLQRLGKAQKFPEFTLSTVTRESVAFALKPGAEFYELPADFFRQKYELNLAALKDARKAGSTLPEQITVAVSQSTSVTLRNSGKKAEADAEALAS
jgi:hypothetical protein